MMVKSVSKSFVDFWELQVSNQEMLEALLVTLFLARSKKIYNILERTNKRIKSKRSGKVLIPYIEKKLKKKSWGLQCFHVLL